MWILCTWNIKSMQRIHMIYQVLFSLKKKTKKQWTLKAPITTAADNIHKYFFIGFFFFFQMIHIKHQTLFS